MHVHVRSTCNWLYVLCWLCCSLILHVHVHVVFSNSYVHVHVAFKTTLYTCTCMELYCLILMEFGVYMNKYA